IIETLDFFKNMKQKLDLVKDRVEFFNMSFKLGEAVGKIIVLLDELIPELAAASTMIANFKNSDPLGTYKEAIRVALSGKDLDSDEMEELENRVKKVGADVDDIITKITDSILPKMAELYDGDDALVPNLKNSILEVIKKGNEIVEAADKAAEEKQDKEDKENGVTKPEENDGFQDILEDKRK